MSHMGARVFTVLRDDRPYELRDTEVKPISKMAARALILAKYQVAHERAHLLTRVDRRFMMYAK